MSDTSSAIAERPMEWLKDEISEVLRQWEKENKAEGYWRKPLVAVAEASDPLFLKLKRAVAEDHAMPVDILPEAQSVVVFFLPFRRLLGEENATAGAMAARSWCRSYVDTNTAIGEINAHLKRRFEQLGYQASVTPATHNFDQERLISRWSHKHLGYIAGLGTFGRNHMLITKSGCCGRLGSLVTSLRLPATTRPTGEYCLLKAGHACRACIAKCTYGALKKMPFDRHACYAQCLRNDAFYEDLPLVDVCGKCAAEVPCSYEVPELPEK